MSSKGFFPPREGSRSLTDRLEDGLLPLINVVFLLLMFFLIAGIILRDEAPSLPDSSITKGNERPELDLVAESSGELRFHGQPLSREELGSALPDYDPARKLRLAADAELSMQQLETLFSDLARAGHPRVVLLTRRKE